MFVCCVCFQVEVSATSWSLVQRSPTDCGASLCVITKPRERRGHSPRWAAEPEMMIIIIIIYCVYVRPKVSSNQYALAILSSLACQALQYVSTLSKKRHDLKKNKI